MTTETRNAEDHREAVALLEGLAANLRLPLNVVHDLAKRVTGRPWEELDAAGAEEVAGLLAEALDRAMARQAA